VRGEVAEEIHKEGRPREGSGESGEVVGFLRPMMGVCGCSIGWRDPIRIFGDLRCWFRTSCEGVSPECTWEGNVDLGKSVS
jgi:hypothetical protein